MSLGQVPIAFDWQSVQTSLAMSGLHCTTVPHRGPCLECGNIPLDRCSRVAAKSVAAPTAPPKAHQTSVQRNVNLGKLQAGYLFPEIAKRRRAHQEAHPEAHVISLGIGDTTEPIPTSIAAAMSKAAAELGQLEGYSGYGAEQGRGDLREALCWQYYQAHGRSPDEIFVSDGSKCDIGRLQMMFGAGVSVAVQDPSYPVYVDSSVIMGMTQGYSRQHSGYGNIQYMVCQPSNDFFPDLSSAPRTDLIFFCSPNNPTGAAANRQQLTELVQHAKRQGSILIYDAAYSAYISDPDCPRTIYEIPGAEEVAIETCSFSKYAGFTGVRLGWTVVPKVLRYGDGACVHADFNRVTSTIFNGASSIAQAGGLACLQPEGLREMEETVAFYKENAAILRKTFQEMGFSVFGGCNAPYVWVGFPGKPSWDVFADILSKCHVVTTPGSGFGPGGEGFVRASAFGHRQDVLEAAERFRQQYSKI